MRIPRIHSARLAAAHDGRAVPTKSLGSCFHDICAEAGRSLAWRLGKYAKRQDVVVLAVPRGELADTLPAPLDVFLLRKLEAQ